MSNRFVHTIYCDDVRREVDNKISLIGCYQGDMLVSAIPGVLPKLCAVVTVATPYEEPFKQLEVLLTKDGEELAKISFPENTLLTVQSSQQEDLGEPFFRRVMTAVLVLSPLSIGAPGIIRVNAVTEEGEIKGPALSIRAAPASDKAPAQ